MLISIPFLARLANLQNTSKRCQKSAILKTTSFREKPTVKINPKWQKVPKEVPYFEHFYLIILSVKSLYDDNRYFHK